MHHGRPRIAERWRTLLRLLALSAAAASLAPASLAAQQPDSRPAPLLDLETVESLPPARPAENPGRDPQRWARFTERVRHADVFPGIDLVFARAPGRLEAVYILSAGADPAAIRIAMPGASRSRLPAGAIAFAQGPDRQLLLAPEGWEVRPRRLAEVPVRFEELSPQRIGLAVEGHDPSRTLLLRVVIESGAPGTPDVAATADDSFFTDADSDTEADPGDVIQYDVVIDNTSGTADAEDVQLEFSADPNTTATVHNITPIALDQTVTTAEDTPVGVTLTGTDFDAGETATLTYTVLTDPPTAEGSLSGTAPNLTFTPAADFNGSTSFTFEVTDAKGDDSNEAGTVTIDVTAVNDPPTFTSSATVNAPENQTAVIDVESDDTEGDTEGSGLTYSVTGGADQALFSIDPNTGVLTFNTAPDFDAPGDANSDNVYEVQVTVTDSGSETASQDLQVTVTDVNEAPTITSSATPSAAENQTAVVDVQSTDDGDAEGSGLTYSLTGGADQALFSIAASTGVLTFDTAPNFEAPGDANSDNVYEVQVTVTDSGGLTGVQNLQVTVTNVNEAPLHTGSTFGEKLQASDVDFQTLGNTAFRFGPTQPAGEISVFVDSDTEGGDLLDNWSDPEMAGLSTVAETVATTNGGSVTIAAEGTYVYTPPAGTTVADDQFTYRVTDGGSTASRNVTIDVIAPIIWYVENDAAADGGGSSTEPFDTLAEAQTASGTGDTIYVREGDGTTTGQDAGIVLQNNQVLLGEGVALRVSATVNGVVDPTLLAAGNRPVIANGGAGGTGDAVRLVNITGTVRGVEIAGTTGDGIEVVVDGGGTHAVTLEDNVIGGLTAPVGPGLALRASSGMLTAAVNRNTGVYSVTDDAFFANGSGGTLYITQFAGNSVSGNTAGDGFDIRDTIFDADPGDAAFTGHTVSWGDTDVGTLANRVGTTGIVLTNVTGAISFSDLDTFAAAGHAVQVVNAGGDPFDAAAGTGFEITFPSGSTLDAIGGAALHVDPADVAGTIGTANATGGSAGIRLEDVGGSLTISGGSLTAINGVAFAIVDGTVGVDFGGDITQGANFAAVSVSGGHQTGTVTFQTGTINATNGTGLQFDNADGTYEFNGTTTLDGGDAGIDILNGSAGTFTFGAGASITNPSGTAFNLSGGAPTVTYQGTITQTSAANAVNVSGATGGSRTFTGAIVANTGTAIGVDLDGPGTTSFSGGLDIDTTTAIGFQATGGGTVNATGTNSIAVGAAPNALDLNGVTIGASDLSFTSVSSSSPTTGELIDIDSTSNAGTISIDTVTSPGTTSGAGIDITGSSAGFTVAGTATIDNTAAAGIDLNGANGAVWFNSVDIDNTGGTGVDISVNTNSVTISGGSIGATNDPTSTALDIAGGVGAIDVGASITKSSVGRVVEITGRVGGTVTVSGNLSCYGGCTGINVDTNTAGSTVFSGSSKVIDTGANPGFTLSNSAAFTVTLSGGGLDIDTTSGAGFNATSGTVNVTGANNSVTSTTGTAVNIKNATIGAGGVTFRSVSSNGGANPGIVLDTTGSSGGFEVTGSGATGAGFSANNASGGTIENKTGNGVTLKSTERVSLNYMVIQNNAGSGIQGTGVNGFELTRSNLANNGDAVDESALRFGLPDGSANGLIGTTAAGTHPTRLSHVDVSASSEHNVEIINTSGTLTDLVVENSRFRDTSLSGLGADGFLIETRNSAIATVSVSGSTFEDNSTQGFQGQAIDSSSLTVNVTGSTFDANNEGLVLSNALNGDLTFDISDNPTFANHPGVAIFVGTTSSATAAATVTGEITNNTITTPSGGVNHSLIVFPSGASTATIVVDSNDITNSGFFRGINVTTTDNSGDTTDLAITVTNNTVANGSDADHAIVVEGRESASVCAKIADNTATAVSATKFGIRLRERDSSTVQLETGASASPDPAIVLSDNNASSVGFSVTGSPAVVANNTCRQVP